MAEELIDSYSETNSNAYATLKGRHPSSSSLFSGQGQSFTCDNVRKITSAKFDLKKTGLPTGMAHAVLYEHSGTYGTSSLPTGEPLATSDDFDVEDLATDPALKTFTFTGEEQYEMQADTKYCICYENPATGNIDASNSVDVGTDTTDASHDGNRMAHANGAWLASATFDTPFYVYGEAAAPPPTVGLPPPMGFNFRMGIRGGLGRPPLGTGGCSIGG